MTPDFRRKASIRSESLVNTAVKWASRRTADWLSSVPAAGMGPGCPTAAKGGGPQRDCLSNQAGDRAGSDPRSGRSQSGPRGGFGRRSLWDQHGVPRGNHRTGTALCRGGAKFADGLGARPTALAGEVTRKNGAAPTAVATLPRASTRVGEAVGNQPVLQLFPGSYLA